MEPMITRKTQSPYAFRRGAADQFRSSFRETQRRTLTPPDLNSKPALLQTSFSGRNTKPLLLQTSCQLDGKRLSYYPSPRPSMPSRVNRAVQSIGTVYEIPVEVNKYSKAEEIQTKVPGSFFNQRPSSMESKINGGHVSRRLVHVGYDRQTSMPGKLPSTNERETALNEYSSRRTVSDSEVLNPFDLLSNFKRQSPSYWVGCIYKYIPKNEVLQVIVRQTGVLPDILQKCKFSKLSASVNFTGKRGKHHVTLVKSPNDKSFRSTVLTFNVKSGMDMRENSLTMKLYHHKNLVCKKVIAVWTIPLAACTNTEKSEWNRYSP